MQQIFFNLLSNAVKFTPEGGSVSVTARRENQGNGRIGYYIDVRDTGIGIAEEAQERIFEPFEQAGPQTKNGTGLGLAIVKNLIGIMGGSISVESIQGSGTTFRVFVSFPVSENQSVASDKPERESVDFSGRSVLVVEDNPINMEIACKLLERKGCRVTSVYNGQDAVDMILHCGPDEFQAVLMDIQMPVLNGLDASRKIRASERSDLKTLKIIAMAISPSAKVVMCSAIGQDATIMEAVRSGATEFIVKPFKKDQLSEMVINLLG